MAKYHWMTRNNGSFSKFHTVLVWSTGGLATKTKDLMMVLGITMTMMHQKGSSIIKTPNVASMLSQVAMVQTGTTKLKLISETV